MHSVCVCVSGGAFPELKIVIKMNKCVKCDTVVFLSDSGGACKEGGGGE